MAGLVAAMELKRAGHTVTILEASRRVGGRVWTLREPYFTHGLYAEGGAMRIPAVHKLTMSYIRKFGLETQPFIMERKNQFVLINNRRLTWMPRESLPYGRPASGPSHRMAFTGNHWPRTLIKTECCR